MCLATPMKIKSVDGKSAVVEHDGKDFPVSLQLKPEAKVGDWVLAHGEIVINTIPEGEAKEILKMIQTSGGSCHIKEGA